MAIFRGLYFSAFLSLPTVICSEARFWGQFWGRKTGGNTIRRYNFSRYVSKKTIILSFLFIATPV